ncbi:MAG: septal ring lytic transglycosylase RlpA family lipoprotein [Rickettsiales bacterium]|nr:MAG: septal ring lytic transglycosylase RlpA family lipoprotein [Rickettsiales bacterium]
MSGNIRDSKFYQAAYSLCSILLVICLSLSLASCNSAKKKRLTYQTLSRDDPHNTHYKGHYKIGKKYKIKRRGYRPREVRRYNKVGIASWYGSRYGFHGKKTANGDIYNKNLLTAAHKTLQLPCLVKVKNLENGKSVIVLVNDRGPYAKNRIIDLSEKAAKVIGMRKKGTAKVRVKYLHSESKQLLKTLRLKKKPGAKAKRSVRNKKCSVNCYVKLVNLKHRRKRIR